jgi:hypothetical protein
MIQILYGTGSSLYQADPVHGVHVGTGDHEVRAKALATVIPGSHCAPVSLAGIQKPGLDTLTYWGHGDATHFCDLTADDFVKHVSNWKKWNPSLKAVEIITCNARHNATGLAFTARVRPALRKKYSDIVLKGMPMGVGSIAAHNWSILKAHAPTKTWFYVTAGGNADTDEMWPAVHLVDAEALNNGSNLAIAGANVEKANPSRKFGLRYGTFDKLRSVLTTIA